MTYSRPKSARGPSGHSAMTLGYGPEGPRPARRTPRDTGHFRACLARLAQRLNERRVGASTSPDPGHTRSPEPVPGNIDERLKRVLLPSEAVWGETEPRLLLTSVQKARPTTP